MGKKKKRGFVTDAIGREVTRPKVGQHVVVADSGRGGVLVEDAVHSRSKHGCFQIGSDRDKFRTPMRRARQSKEPNLAIVIVAKIWRARSRLYQSRCLQMSIHVAVFFKLYKNCAFLRSFYS